MALDLSTTKSEEDELLAEKQRRTQVSDPSLFDRAVGVSDVALSMVSALPATAIGGIAGLLTSLTPGTAAGSGAEVVKRVTESLTFEPKTETGRQQLQAVGETLAPISEGLEAIGDALGRAGAVITGPINPALGFAIGKALPEAAGLALAGGLPKIITFFKRQSPTQQRITRLLEKGATDVETASYKLKKSLDIEAPRVVKDPIAIETIRQGFDEGVIAAVKGSSPANKTKMLRMVDIMEKGKKNARFATNNRPADVAGNSLLDRFRVVLQANRKAGKELDSVANSLRGKQVDSVPAVNSFLDDLGSIGVTLGEDLKPNFRGSDIEGLPGPEAAINRIVRRMTSTTGRPDSFELHRLKRFIDETVSFGKGAEGLTGRTEGILKNLRHNLDQTLDAKFPEYNRVNTVYSETIGAIDALQDVAGKKLNLTGKRADKATGTLMRRLMSNAQSRVNLLDALDEIERVAKRQGAIFDDDLLTQVLLVDELDAVFKPVARTSFQGQIGQALESAGQQPTLVGMGVKAAKEGAKKLQGINQEGAFKAIKDLLRDTNLR